MTSLTDREPLKRNLIRTQVTNQGLIIGFPCQDNEMVVAQVSTLGQLFHHTLRPRPNLAGRHRFQRLVVGLNLGIQWQQAIFGERM